MRLILPIIVFMSLFSAAAWAGRNEVVMPYGDYSQWCSAYGMCKENIGSKEAEEAIEGYFASKGLKVRNVQHRGRFIEAEIYRNSRPHDKILFDRKTGRIRTIY